MATLRAEKQRSSTGRGALGSSAGSGRATPRQLTTIEYPTITDRSEDLQLVLTRLGTRSGTQPANPLQVASTSNTSLDPNADPVDSSQTTQDIQLDDAISQGRRWLFIMYLEPDEDRASALLDLARLLDDRFERTHQQCDLEEASKLIDEALTICTELNADRTTALEFRASTLSSLFIHTGRLEHLEAAIVAMRESLALQQHSDDRGRGVMFLVVFLILEYNHTGRFHHYDEALTLALEAFALFPDPEPPQYMSIALANLASLLILKLTHFQQRQSEDLDTIFKIVHVLSLLSRGNSDQKIMISLLGDAFYAKFKFTNRLNDLEEAVKFHRKSLMFIPRPNITRWWGLNDLGDDLYDRFILAGNIADLDESIALYREAEYSCPGPLGARRFTGLIKALTTRYDFFGRREDLQELAKVGVEG
ncbi:hypothetical protein JAAARDRAFT_201285 [Jaapia argillacea MUCL 33604]|uniref:Uncharacterized protein n=1 Tax=Jaapia argillacea MUCL 33604 TaxID=933084 RepID=A0A067P548_9AGAM|nr:hypothetical protein JAAARDRAFT_201285 [Jaapia argillacea MUCL 33604]